MTDKTKYKNVSLSHEVHGTLQYLSKVLLPGTKLSISKTVETIANSYQKEIKQKESGLNKELNVENIN
tara:strand:+ start:219 stop:422 length:204 start_codon:yes stop_codon:yes gene_type:complete